MLSAIRSFFKGYANFSGRSTRSEYWWIYFTNLLICLPAYTKYHDAVSTRPYNMEALRSLQAMSGFYFFLAAILMLPSIAVTVRRLRDVGIHWAYIFIVFVPLGALTLLIMLAMPSQRFREKVIENSEKNEENKKDYQFEDMVRKY